MKTKRFWVFSLSLTLILAFICSLLILFSSQRAQAATNLDIKCKFIVNYNGKTVVPINGYYYFFEGNASTVTVNVSFLDKVVPFAIFYVQSPEVEVRLEYVSDEYK